MKKDQESIEKIEQYLAGMLDDEEQIEFEELIASDKELAGKAETYKLLIDGIKYSGRKGLQVKLEEWDLDLPHHLATPELNKNKRQINWYYIAAAISFFMIASALVYMNLDTGYHSVVAKHYQVYDHLSPGVRGEGDEENSLNAVFQYYNQGQYIKTIKTANQLEQSERTNEVKFILANAYMAIDNVDEASVLFEEISASKNEYEYASKWYLSLCYLSKEDPDKALLILHELKDSTSSYSRNAKELLADLN